jgi:hypothetical protein
MRFLPKLFVQESRRFHSVRPRFKNVQIIGVAQRGEHGGEGR